MDVLELLASAGFDPDVLSELRYLGLTTKPAILSFLDSAIKVVARALSIPVSKVEAVTTSLREALAALAALASIPEDHAPTQVIADRGDRETDRETKIARHTVKPHLEAPEQEVEAPVWTQYAESPYTGVMERPAWNKRDEIGEGEREIEDTREDLGDDISNARLRFLGVDTWEAYCKLMLLFLLGKLPAHFTHFGPLTPDYGPAPSSLLALNRVGKWISSDGQPPVPHVVERRRARGKYRPCLKIQRPYIEAFVPTAQIEGLMSFCARNNLYMKVHAAVLRRATLDLRKDWLTKSRFLRPEELESLSHCTPKLALDIANNGSDLEEGDDVDEPRGGDAGKRDEDDSEEDYDSEEEDEEDDSEDDSEEDDSEEDEADVPSGGFSTRRETKFFVENDSDTYYFGIPPLLKANVAEQGKYMFVWIYSRVTSLRLTDLLYEQFVSKL